MPKNVPCDYYTIRYYIIRFLFIFYVLVVLTILYWTATNDYFHYRSICCLSSWLIDYLVCKNSVNSEKCQTRAQIDPFTMLCFVKPMVQTYDLWKINSKQQKLELYKFEFMSPLWFTTDVFKYRSTTVKCRSTWFKSRFCKLWPWICREGTDVCAELNNSHINTNLILSAETCRQDTWPAVIV